MSARPRIAVVGAGLIGRRHALALRRAESAALAAIVDPSPDARAFARELGVPWRKELDALTAAGGADGVILATPNQAHVEGGLACVAAGLPVLIEKPIAGDVAGGKRLVEAAEAAGVPLAIGHHRRHNPIITVAKAMIEIGKLGRIATVSAFCWLRKPDDYFDVDWRRRPGAGPILINLIHDIDLLHYLVGPISEVSAFATNAARGFEVEDAAALTLRFASGAVGSATVSDCAAAPWSWELTARENPVYPATGENAYFIGGSEGSLALPNLTFWSCAGAPSWHTPISATRTPISFEDPIDLQVAQFASVIRDGAPPLVSGRDGLAALAVVEAARRSAETGAPAQPAIDAAPPESPT